VYIEPSGRLERSLHSLTDQPSQTIRLRLKDQLPESNLRGDDDDDDFDCDYDCDYSGDGNNGNESYCKVRSIVNHHQHHLYNPYHYYILH
jgi:hypothetical protein